MLSLLCVFFCAFASREGCDPRPVTVRSLVRPSANSLGTAAGIKKRSVLTATVVTAELLQFFKFDFKVNNQYDCGQIQ